MSKNKIDLESVSQVRIRVASIEDSELIWKWRNDPVTRKNSLNEEEISWESHTQWFTRTLSDDCKIVFIGEEVKSSQSIGMVRFDRSADGFSADVAINMGPQWRGKGLSHELLGAAISKFSEATTCVLTAVVKLTNEASKKCFEKCGFSVYERSERSYLLKNKQLIIDQIEQVRSRNNVNWMDLMRLAFRVAPKEAEEIFRKVNSDDGKIAELLNQLTR